MQKANPTDKAQVEDAPNAYEVPTTWRMSETSPEKKRKKSKAEPKKTPVPKSVAVSGTASVVPGTVAPSAPAPVSQQAPLSPGMEPVASDVYKVPTTWRVSDSPPEKPPKTSKAVPTESPMSKTVPVSGKEPVVHGAVALSGTAPGSQPEPSTPQLEQAIGSDGSVPTTAPAAVEHGKVLTQNKRSKPFDPMLLVSGIMLSVLLISILTFATLLLRRLVYTPDRLCNSADCHLVASVLTSSLNRSVHPCDDFYTFVCGSLQGPERGVMRQTSELRIFLRELNLDISYLRNSEYEDFFMIMMKPSLHYGLHTLVRFFIEDAVRFNGKRVLQIHLNQKEVVRLKRMDYDYMKYREESRHFLLAYGLYQDDLGTEIDNILSIERKVGAVLAERIFRGQKHGTKIIKASQLQEYTNGATRGSWLSTITSLTSNMYSGQDHVEAQRKALDTISFLLSEMKSRDVHNLLAWSMLRLLLPFANGKLFASKHSDSAPECVARVEAIMEPALWAPYFFKETWTGAVGKAKLIISDLRKAFRSRLEKAAWMDAESRKTALRKLDNTDIFTGFPDAVTDEKNLNKYYEKYQWDDGEFFKHWKNGAFERHQSLIHEQKNVFFNVSAPRVSYPERAGWAAVGPALLQPPLFIKDGPDSFNYGSLGQLVVSALMRGYDVRGSEIDDKGGWKTWWTDSTREQYTTRLNCLRTSASEVQYQGAGVPEDLLAEIASLSVAYKAFLELPASKRNVVLPGLQFSSSQIFFVAHCAKMCELSEGIERDHLSSHTKCNVPLRHEANFAHAFKCSANSHMNAEKRCSVW